MVGQQLDQQYIWEFVLSMAYHRTSKELAGARVSWDHYRQPKNRRHNFQDKKDTTQGRKAQRIVNDGILFLGLCLGFSPLNFEFWDFLPSIFIWDFLP